MIRARKEGVREEDLIARMREAHLADFTAFQIEFDNYGSTHSPEIGPSAKIFGSRCGTRAW